MPDILIRGVDAEIVKRLKRQAKQHGRSLQAEAKTIIEKGARMQPEDIAAMLDRWHKHFAGRKSDVSSADLIREDRER